jgi:hypothetical protein
MAWQLFHMFEHNCSGDELSLPVRKRINVSFLPSVPLFQLITHAEVDKPPYRVHVRVNPFLVPHHSSGATRGLGQS